MPRQPRYDLPGLPQHVIQRGNNRQAVFFEEADYRRYLDDLNEVSEKVGCLIHAYVLMTNHVHLLVTPTESAGISRLIQGLGRRYVAYVNGTYQRTGTLWEGRYKASLVAADDYLLTCMRYIELNPVRAGMVEHPADYRWSSFNWNAHGLSDGVQVSSHSCYLALGKGHSERQYAYRELFRQALPAEQVHAIRDTTNSCLVLGNDRFREEVARATGQRTTKGRAGRPRSQENAV
jgi:putative transposase